MDINTVNSQRIKDAFKIKSPIGVDFIRIGSESDGGYVLVNDIKNTDFLISMGIANDVTFEQQIGPMVYEMHLYDYSIDRLPEDIEKSYFFKERIGSESHYIFDRVEDEKDIILKIDIEGGEWDFFRSLSHDQINRFRQIAIEIHWLLDNEWLQIPGFHLDIIEKINQTHQIVALHPNNYQSYVIHDKIKIPQVLEITFLRKDSYDFLDKPTDLSSLFTENCEACPKIIDYL